MNGLLRQPFRAKGTNPLQGEGEMAHPAGENPQGGPSAESAEAKSRLGSSK